MDARSTVPSPTRLPEQLGAPDISLDGLLDDVDQASITSRVRGAPALPVCALPASYQRPRPVLVAFGAPRVGVGEPSDRCWLHATARPSVRAQVIADNAPELAAIFTTMDEVEADIEAHAAAGHQRAAALQEEWQALFEQMTNFATAMQMTMHQGLSAPEAGMDQAPMEADGA
jgi:hypothetical protein